MKCVDILEVGHIEAADNLAEGAAGQELRRCETARVANLDPDRGRFGAIGREKDGANCADCQRDETMMSGFHSVLPSAPRAAPTIRAHLEIATAREKPTPTARCGPFG